jgi:hypothetical protein
VFVAALGSAQTASADDPGLRYIPSVGNLTVVGGSTGNVISGRFVGTATSALYADLAEIYKADANYQTGTVMVFDGEQEVTISNNYMSTKVAGVISEKPAYLMNSNLQSEFTAIIALQGRVPAKVLGPVGKGDMLVTAPDGYVTACSSPIVGSVVGKSLENFTATDDLPATILEIVVGRT